MDTPGPRPCPAAAALGVVGERWSLLIVRELAYGVRRFEGIQRATGAPRNMLATRLKSLERAGVVERRAYLEHPPRYDYVLTASGQELVPVLTALSAWGEKHLPAWGPEAGGHPTMPLRHHDGDGDHRLRPVLTCATCDQAIDQADVTLGVADPWAQPATTARAVPGQG